jgi:protein-S-isoprenylcysteine O-methyltransferase Ste14
VNDRPPLPSLGPRGEGWVAIQIALFGAILAAGLAAARWPLQARIPRLMVAVLVGVAGASLLGAGIRALGESITPLPRPNARAVLRQHGVYGLVRHPIYGGVMLLALAWSLLSSPWALVPTVALAGLLLMKSRIEEHWLGERFPDYPEYARRVRHRFLPFVW